MEKCLKIAALYIATLKAMSLIFQQRHWTTKGSNFYGDHLLFERLYNASLENLDAAAERFIGLFGDDCLNYDLQTDLLHKVLLKYANLEGSPVQMCLAVIKDFLAFGQEAYNVIEEEGKMTLGLDDLSSAISSKCEEAVYLLQQTLDKD